MYPRQVLSSDNTSCAPESKGSKASPNKKSTASNYIGELKVEEAWNESEEHMTKLGIKP